MPQRAQKREPRRMQALLGNMFLQGPNDKRNYLNSSIHQNVGGVDYRWAQNVLSTSQNN